MEKQRSIHMTIAKQYWSSKLLQNIKKRAVYCLYISILLVYQANTNLYAQHQHFHIDPNEGTDILPAEPIFDQYIQLLASSNTHLHFADGRAEMHPKQLVVGHTYDFTWKYFPETKYLEAGSKVSFAIPGSWDQPQSKHPEMPGYAHALSNKKENLEITITQNTNIQWWVNITVPETGVDKDGWVELSFTNVTIQRFPQYEFINWRNAMRVVLESEVGEFSVVRKEKTEKPVIRAAPPDRFHVVTTSVAHPGQKIQVRVSTLDFCDNPAYPSPVGEIFVALPEDPFVPLASKKLKPEDKGQATFEITVPAETKETFRVIVSNRKDNLRGMSPLIIVRNQAENMQVYFGDIHNHTVFSDGLKHPDASYYHARNVSLLDFCSITDHNSTEASKIEGPFVTSLSDSLFILTQEITEKYNQPGRFVTIQGYEQNFIKGWPGHRNVYFRGICPGIFRGKTLDELYDYLDGHRAMLIPHHPVIWHTRPHLENTEYERLAEIYSMHCSSEERETPLINLTTNPRKKQTGVTTREMLDEGYKIGFIGASDNHQGMPGLGGRPGRFTNLVYTMGMAAVYAPELSREAIFDGLYNKHCYATTGARIFLELLVDNQPMGTEVMVDKNETVPVKITVAGTNPVSKIEIIQNNTEKTVWKYNGNQYVKYEDNVTFDQNAWLYIRVTQVDRHIAWSSPVWINVSE